MIRRMIGLSFPILFLNCESQESRFNLLFLNRKSGFEIFFFGPLTFFAVAARR